jgi:hypothetical protein
MAPFFDTPGSTAGPYHTPPQQGIFSKILQGVDVALKLGDFYQNWQTKSQAQKTGALQGMASKIGLIQALNPEGAAASPEISEQAKELGIPLPKLTEEARGKMGEKVITGITPTAGEMLPGGGMATRLSSPELAGKQTAYTRGMAAIPEVGTAMIPGKQSIDQMKLDVLKGMEPGKRGEALFPKTIPNVTTVKGMDGNWYQVPGRFASERAPGETSAEKTARQIAVKGTAPGGGGKGGGGRPDVITAAKQFELSYQEEKAKPGNENLTRVQFRKMWGEAGRSDPTKIVTKVTESDTPGGRGSQKIITKERAGDTAPPPSPSGSQYMLQKGGQMIPVDKETYDAYQKKYGLQ